MSGNTLAFLVLQRNPKPFVYLLPEARLRASCLPSKFATPEPHTLQAPCPPLKINSSAFEKQLWLTTRTSQDNYRHTVTREELSNCCPDSPRSIRCSQQLLLQLTDLSSGVMEHTGKRGIFKHPMRLQLEIAKCMTFLKNVRLFKNYYRARHGVRHQKSQQLGGKGWRIRSSGSASITQQG